MKKCPTCDKTFDDGMRFCQTDGTPLVDISETESDPYRTVVSNQNEIAAPPADPFKTVLGVQPANRNEEDFSQNQAREEMKDAPPPSPFDNASSSKGDFGESDIAPSEAPKFNEPSLNAPDFGDLSSPESSPKSQDAASSDSTLILNTGSEIDSPPFSEGTYNQSNFENPSSPATSTPFETPLSPSYQPPFKEPEQPFGGQSNPFNQSPFEQSQNPFGQQSSPYNAPMQETEWAPPPAPVSNWQDQGLGANTPFQPPVAGQGQNQTLAIVSLVCGILSVFCCAWFLPGIVAVVLGFMAKNKADQNPAEYGGRGMAVAGMITGGISVVLGIIVTILWFLGTFAGRF